MSGSPYSYQSGAGGGSSAATSGSGKNYLATVNTVNGNGDFELGTTGKWSLGVTGALVNALPSTTPTFGSGASGNLSIAAFNTSPLAGSWSLRYASSTATTAGDCLASDAFTIDLEDQAKVMTVKFYYRAQVNPTNGDWSGTSANSFAWAIYDVTNSVWIIPAGAFGMTQNSGIGYCTGTFQTSAAGTSYRLVVYNANASAGAITVDFDDFFLGPQTAPLGPAMTDWATQTVTGSWVSNTTYLCRSRRVGDEKQYIVQVSTSGAPTSASLTVNLPAGDVIDTTKLTNSTALKTVVGAEGNADDSGTGYKLFAAYSSTTAVAARYQSNASGAESAVTQAAPFTFGASDFVVLSFQVPIAGLSSNVQMSNDTDTRVVSFRGNQASQAVTANVTNIAFTSVKDSHAGWNGTQYTVPVSGDYVVAGSFVSSQGVTGVIYINAVGQTTGFWSGTTPNSSTAASGSTLVTGLKAGDILSVRANASVTITTGSLQIYRLSGPSVIAASETVAARYGDISNSIGTGATTAFYSTKVYDTHNAYNTTTGVYTVPVSGKYRVGAKMASIAQSPTTSERAVQMTVRKNSSVIDLTQVLGNGGGSLNYNHMIETEINLVAGDTIDIQANCDTAGIPAGGVSQNVFTISRFGN